MCVCVCGGGGGGGGGGMKNSGSRRSSRVEKKGEVVEEEAFKELMCIMVLWSQTH